MRGFLMSLVFLVAASGSLSAQQRPVVIELFTSQGCSSCPAADQLLHDLNQRDDVLALSLHVDYWDYIGWKDVFGRPANTKRQYAYAAASGRDMVYTPQMIINGALDVVGNRVADVHAAIVKVKRQAPPVVLDARREGNLLTVAARGTVGPVTLLMVRYQPDATVEITRGENSGRSVDYVNVVRDMREIGVWSGQQPLDLQVPFQEGLPAAVLIQKQPMGEIVAAAVVEGK